jgi:AraC-like DNA-binding protein
MVQMETTLAHRRSGAFQTTPRPDESFRVIEIGSGYSGCSWHSHPELQISFVIRGAGQRAIGDSLHPIESGEIILVGSNIPHVWRYDRPSCEFEVEAVAIHFRKDFLGPDFFDTPEMRDVRLLLSRAGQGLQFVGHAREQLTPLLQSLRQLEGIERLLKLLAILNVMASTREVLTLSSVVLQPIAVELDQERLQRVCDYVATRFDGPLTRDLAADLACLSPSAFSRFFKTRTGCTFRDYVADVRVGHACRLLLDDDGSITEIAHRCGFEDLSTFNRTFRKRKNLSPNEYRARMRRLSHVD